jgi:hypothetical protein
VLAAFILGDVYLLGGLGTYLYLRGILYWGIAIVLIIVTKGRLGSDSTDICMDYVN